MMIVAGNTRVRPGQPYPSGVTWTGLDVNFAISLLMRRASAACFPLPEDTGSVWHDLPEDARALSTLATTGVRVVPVTG